MPVISNSNNTLHELAAEALIESHQNPIIVYLGRKKNKAYVVEQTVQD